MASLLVIGAGVMGSAITAPAADNGHRVRLAGTHLDGDIIAALRADRAGHPRLGAGLAPGVEPLAHDELEARHIEEADLVVVGVSSPGIGWAGEVLRRLMKRPRPVAFVTKGLVDRGTRPPATYNVTMPEALAGVAGPFIGVGGPCIARELALRQPTSVIVAGPDAGALAAFAGIMATPYYRVHAGDDATGVEAAAALKNFFAIGVSAMLSRYEDAGRGQAFKNPVAAAFSQALEEMAELIAFMGGRAETAFGLAGAGDLHVTVGGGRNARLGQHLGRGLSLAEAVAGPLAGETVEGIDTGLVLRPSFEAALAEGRLDAARFPLTRAILDVILTRGRFAFDFTSLGLDGRASRRAEAS